METCVDDTLQHIVAYRGKALLSLNNPVTRTGNQLMLRGHLDNATWSSNASNCVLSDVSRRKRMGYEERYVKVILWG